MSDGPGAMSHGPGVMGALAVLLALATVAAPERHVLRVINGFPDDAGQQHEYIVLIVGLMPKHQQLSRPRPIKWRVPAKRLCTAAVVAERWALTAAHCIVMQTSMNRRIITKNYTTAPTLNVFFYRVLRSIPHPSFAVPFANDIGLLQTAGFNLTTRGRLSAIDYKSLAGRAVRYYGYGYTMTDRVYDFFPKLKHQTKIKDQIRGRLYGEAVVAKCDRSDLVEKLPGAFICLRPSCKKTEQRATYGDSGGPLLYKGKIVGVASGGAMRGDYHHIVYTATSPYLDWIERTIHIYDALPPPPLR